MSSRFAAAALAACLALSCNNSPYTDDVPGEKVIYGVFQDAPRRLDPAEAYDVVAHRLTGLVNDKLLDYHYLKRPFTLIPSLALEVPQPEPQPGGGVIYRFRMRLHGQGCGKRHVIGGMRQGRQDQPALHHRQRHNLHCLRRHRQHARRRASRQHNRCWH